jgi:hypothetical protein
VLAKEKKISDSVDFGLVQLIYELQVVDDYALSSTYSNNTVTVYIPQSMVTELAETDKVGFENERHLPHLLVEKDFTCLDGVDEDQSDNYPNPLASKKI